MTYGLEKYKPGQVWERDGKRRQIHSVVGGNVNWRRPHKGVASKTPAVRLCWCSTWLEWASKARLVEDAE